MCKLCLCQYSSSDFSVYGFSTCFSSPVAKAFYDLFIHPLLQAKEHIVFLQKKRCMCGVKNSSLHEYYSQ